MVVAFRNQERYLERTLESVSRQDYGDFEVILVDDASTDGSSKAAFLMAERNGWEYARRDRSSGPAEARAEGVRRSRGRLIAFLDGDDLWRPEKLRIQSEWMRRPGVVMTFCEFDLIDAGDNALLTDGRPAKLDMRRSYSFYPHPCMTSMVMLNRQALEKVGGIATHYRYLYDDSDLWVRIHRRFGTNGWRCIPKQLGSYRVHEGGVSNLLKLDLVDERAVQARLDLACFQRQCASRPR